MQRLISRLGFWLLPIAVVATLTYGCNDSDNLVSDEDTTTGGTTDSGDGDGDGDSTATGDGDGDNTATGDGDGDGDGTATGDGDGDAPAGCDPDGSECNNCVDDDGDGQIDGNDVECTGIDDDDEGSFGTSIPGDNNAAKRQDCFFDGDTGPGNDGCDRPTCCFYDPANDYAACPEEVRETGNKFPPTPEDCAVTPECAEKCGSAAPAGCDCFGCCTVCNGDGCFDVLARDGCTADDIGSCQSCVKATDCGTSCDDDPTDCILCPGQTQDDLPLECTEQACPGDAATCADSGDCEGEDYCNNGCCTTPVIGFTE